MRPLTSRRTSAVARGLILALLLLAALPLPARAYVIFTWNSGASGSFDDPNRWTPYGVPGWADYADFSQPLTYSVSFPGTAPLTQMLNLVDGNVTFNVDSPHTTHEFLLGGGAVPTLTVAYGTINADYLSLGYPGSNSHLTLTGSSFQGSAQLHTYSMGNRYYSGSGGDVIGYGGIATLEVLGGARYVCERSQQGSWPLQLGVAPNTVGNLNVAGRNANLLQYSGVQVTGSELGEGMIVGVQGVSNVFAYNGGFIDVAGRMMIAQTQTSQGYVTVGPVAVFGTSSLNVHDHLWIGYNFYDTVLAGHGEVTVKNRAWARVGGRCDVGDPDNDAGSVLRVTQGGTFRVNGGLKVWPTAGPGLDLRGGLTHVRGGAFEWPAGKYLSVSSQVGTPELYISDGVTSTGPNASAGISQLFVGRGGTGTLRLAQPGTNFAMGLGATTLGDSLGGVGTVVVDSTAAITGGGSFNVGVRGNGFLNVLHGGTVDAGAMAIGVASTGLGDVLVQGAGSALTVRDNLWIGGGYSGAGSTGSVEADSAGVVNVLHVNGVNPALTTIFDYGSLSVSYGGKLVTSGTVSNAGDIYLSDGEIQAMNVSQPPAGGMSGWGLVTAALQNNGSVSPSSYTSNFGRIGVDGSFTQYGAGHYRVDLGSASGVRCDTLAVTGAATLDGALDLWPEGGFAPNPGDVFQVLTCGSRTGQFAAVNWNGSPLAGQAIILYGPTYVQVWIPGGTTGVDPGPTPGTVSELRFQPEAGAGGALAFVLELPDAADVQVRVYDLRGRQTAVLRAGELPAGRHSLTPANGGRDLPSGVYFARAVIAAGGRTTVRTARITLVH